ncbi:MAG: UbiD family decarboxylase [Acidobacteria bacterium]|nr:UbiD family decarboxylase [Acidobacteriota bacterium]MCZ6769453.1 UbiD family decarboxylase [Acidobacteriota bacterium]MCZ6879197.1 UbiD family decarboxylase [Acidobacteriota bacterium]
MDRETVPRFGCTALGELFARQNQYPAFFFRRLKNSRLPLVMNLTATYERLALALGTTTEDKVRTYGERLAKGIPHLEIASEEAPVKQILWQGKDADLGKLPRSPALGSVPWSGLQVVPGLT